MKIAIKKVIVAVLINCFVLSSIGCSKNNSSTISNKETISDCIERVTKLAETKGYSSEKTMPALGVNGSVEFKKGSERVYIEFEDKESCVAYEMDYEINSKEKEDIDVPLICELINLVSKDKIQESQLSEFIFNEDEHREPELEDTEHVEVKRCALDFFETFVVAYSLQYVDFPDKTDMIQYVEFSGEVV